MVCCVVMYKYTYTCTSQYIVMEEELEEREMILRQKALNTLPQKVCPVMESLCIRVHVHCTCNLNPSCVCMCDIQTTHVDTLLSPVPLL